MTTRLRFHILHICWWFCLLLGSSAVAVEFTAQEQQWLRAHSGKTLTLGLSETPSIEQFDYAGKPRGYVQELVALLEQHLDLQIRVTQAPAWSDVYNQFLSGQIDILLGANETPQRKQFMAFTRPIQRYPYVVFANRDSQIRNLGDLHQRQIGFLTDDVVFNLFPENYPHITYQSRTFATLEDAFKALSQHQIDGVISSSGNQTPLLLRNHGDLMQVAALNGISSDMTLATRLADEQLARILDKVIASEHLELSRILDKNSQLYNRKILELTAREQSWLEHKPVVRIGVATDYLPFEYEAEGQYRGITGAFIQQVQALTGLQIQLVEADFNSLYQQMQEGKLDLLNMAKTPERMAQFLFTKPYFKERDIILGHRNHPYVQDVYGLENKRVAVIDGFWHKEYLRRNLRHVEIVTTQNLNQSLELLDSGAVDYLIENPTVLDYYRHGLGYQELEKKGSTAADSFFYLGVNHHSPELVTIINKALAQIDPEQMRVQGLNSVPDLQAQRIRLLVILSSILAIALLVCLVLAILLTRRYIVQRAANTMLKERQQLLYTDPLTGLDNRLSYNQSENELRHCHTPQAWMVIDLNNLKFINDQYGHLAGDQLLIQFSKLLRQSLPPQTLLFRMGGDEFLAVVQDVDETHAHQLERDLLQHLNQEMSQFQEAPLPPGPLAAIGLAWRPDASHLLADTFMLADHRMYEHKRTSKISPHLASALAQGSLCIAD
jgi:diguanylate cyclase (GGDEF)-like protein